MAPTIKSISAAVSSPVNSTGIQPLDDHCRTAANTGRPKGTLKADWTQRKSPAEAGQVMSGRRDPLSLYGGGIGIEGVANAAAANATAKIAKSAMIRGIRFIQSSNNPGYEWAASGYPAGKSKGCETPHT